MNFETLRQALRQARHHAPVERKGVRRIGMTLKEASAISGLNVATIHSIENTKREPDLKPELETIEQLALAYGMALSVTLDSVGAPQVADHESLPTLASEDRIAAAAIRRLTERLSTLERRLRARPRMRPKNHQHDSAARAEAAEKHLPHRSGRRGDAQRKKRPPKEK